MDITKLADKAIVDKEKLLLEKYAPVLISFLHQKIDLQLIAIYALQVFCFTVNFPKGKNTFLIENFLRNKSLNK